MEALQYTYIIFKLGVHGEEHSGVRAFDYAFGKREHASTDLAVQEVLREWSTVLMLHSSIVHVRKQKFLN